MTFYSDAKQDEFAAKMLNYKRDGTYVDIGSCGGYGSNNSCFFESLNWRGICIEINPGYLNTYSGRNALLLIQDATKMDYLKLFDEQKMPASIDYLSLDIDEQSTEVLKILPHAQYRFKVITIEHDYYVHGDKYRSQQRQILSDSGYRLLDADVYVHQPGYGPECSFEDWWVDPNSFDAQFLDKIQSNHAYPFEVIAKIDSARN